MKQILSLTLVLLLAFSDAGAESAAPEWMVGEWQPNRSFYGKDPLDYCVLTVTPNKLSWRERPNTKPREMTFRVVVSEEDFVILQTESKDASRRTCLDVPSPGFLRFDRKDYFHCIQAARRYNKPVSGDCPKPFSDTQSFELTVFRSLENAMVHSNNPTFWTGYHK